MRFNAETQRRGDKRGENQNESKPESAEGAEVCRLAQRGCAWSRDTLGLPRESCGALRRPGLRGLAQRAPRRAYPAASDLVGIFRFSTSVSDGAAIGAIRSPCLLYTSDAADDLLCVDLGGRRIIKKTKNKQNTKKPSKKTKN